MPVTSISWQMRPNCSNEAECFLSSALDGTVKIWALGHFRPLRVLNAPVVSI